MISTEYKAGQDWTKTKYSNTVYIAWRFAKTCSLFDTVNFPLIQILAHTYLDMDNGT